ncbi:hypothetical protein D3C85_831090 [compost metagenome]
MPAPIMPAPSTPTLRVTWGATPCGREPPALIWLSWNQKVPIMFFATWPVVSSVK